MVDKFFAGGPFMYPILVLLIVGIAFVFERWWTLRRADVYVRTFMQEIKSSLSQTGYEGAMEVSSKTAGPVASIFYAGLMRAHKGVEAVEKAIGSAGTIEMAFLERNLIWL